MSLLYKRNIILQIGDDTDAFQVPNTFKIALDIQKVVSAISATGSVSIYNLSDSTKKRLLSRGKRIRIFAGYGDDIPLLHDGDILAVQQIDQGSDRISRINLAGKTFQLNSSIFSKAYQNAVQVKQVVRDAIDNLGLTFRERELDAIPDSATMASATFMQKTSDVLDTILQPYRIQWFEDNGKVFLSKQGERRGSDDNELVQVLNSNTGLIKTAVTTEKGVNAFCLLNPKLKPGGIVKIESDVIKNTGFNTYVVKKKAFNTIGFFKIFQVNYRGDNWDGSFECLIQTIPYAVSQSASNL